MNTGDINAKSSKTSETLPVSEEVQSAAKTVIDHHSDVINQNKLNLLASEIQQEMLLDLMKEILL